MRADLGETAAVFCSRFYRMFLQKGRECAPCAALRFTVLFGFKAGSGAAFKKFENFFEKSLDFL